MLALRVASGEPPPDLRRATVVTATWTPAAAGASAAKAVPLRARLLPTRIRLEGAPEGSGKVRIELTHPHLLPEPLLVIERDVTLERAGLARIEADVPALGGAIDVASSAPFVGVRRRDAPFRRIDATRDGFAELPSLEPGEWLVVDCEDDACRNASNERTELVEAGRTSPP